ncbi:MAG: hypothetical protein GY823_11970 [Flavobacteriaceae bacterium]|nr:hypothetical protein [Flavobacteriaceae bacterium]
MSLYHGKIEQKQMAKQIENLKNKFKKHMDFVIPLQTNLFTEYCSIEVCELCCQRKQFKDRQLKCFKIKKISRETINSFIDRYDMQTKKLVKQIQEKHQLEFDGVIMSYYINEEAMISTLLDKINRHNSTSLVEMCCLNSDEEDELEEQLDYEENYKDFGDMLISNFIENDKLELKDLSDRYLNES